ncbi:SGNH/GDSL hydrolase family protein [Ramlibacter sp. PS4R-6]|uniref:SGNH/GDSL hydrolase family protein n=1 Tax=Ramlibacter sp. PS4R-6 TaxID=3133438 RepID=UPI00309BFF1F
MAFQWMRRVLFALAPAALLALGACGSGSIESQLVPTRLVVFGDGFADQGQAAGKRYTVNDTSKTWPELIAADYGVTTLKASSAGGTNYATGNARVTLEPDAAGSTATLTIKEQVDAFLASSTPGATDLVILQGGLSDIIVQARAVIAGTQTRDQMLANVRQAGLDYADQARRLKAAGATHIAILGAYDLARTPWGISTGQQQLLTDATTAFNNAVLVSLVNEGQTMLYIDTALLFNLMTGNPASYALVNVGNPACTSVDPGPGIGIGTGQVNSLLCTTATIASGVDYATYLWADPVYPTPTGHSRFASFMFTRVHDRF